MTKRTITFSINIVSVLIILISVFIGIVGSTNAWFTSEHKEGIQIIVQVGDLKLNLYQDAVSEENAIYTYEENDKLTTDKQKYVKLDDVIIPDEKIPLNLILTNEDSGSASMYVRFKLELYSRGVDEDTLIPISLGGTDSMFELKPTAEGDDNSGYYYYKSSTATNSKNGLFGKTASGVALMTHFVLNYSDMFDASGNLLLTSSESLYIKLTVDASVTDWLGETAW